MTRRRRSRLPVGEMKGNGGGVIYSQDFLLLCKRELAIVFVFVVVIFVYVFFLSLCSFSLIVKNIKKIVAYS